MTPLKIRPWVMNLRYFFKEGGGHIFKGCVIFLKNMPTSQVVSLALYMYTCGDSAILFCQVLIAYTITANGFCLHF